MKKLLLIVSVFFFLQSAAQQNDNLFLATEIKSGVGRSEIKSYGMSLVYNRLLPATKLGLGAGVELIDLRSKEMGGVMPLIDFRYYSNVGRSAIIPLAQIGYNFYNFQYQDFQTNESYTFKGGLGYALGIGYSYRLTSKGGGPFTAIKYKGLQYRYTDPTLPKAATNRQLNLSIGWRF